MYKTKEDRMKLYKSRSWQSLRQEALRRDNYECQECKRNGYVTLNNPDKHKTLDVDHIKEIYTHPELSLELDNLETLCVRCHNKKHGRVFKLMKKPTKWDGDEKW